LARRNCKRQPHGAMRARSPPVVVPQHRWQRRHQQPHDVRPAAAPLRPLPPRHLQADFIKIVRRAFALCGPAPGFSKLIVYRMTQPPVFYKIAPRVSECEPKIASPEGNTSDVASRTQRHVRRSRKKIMNRSTPHLGSSRLNYFGGPKLMTSFSSAPHSACCP